MDQVQEFLDALHHDPRAKELAKEMKKPETEAETAESYVKLAQAMGYDITGKDILKTLLEMEQAQRALTDKANDAVVKIPLGDDALDHVFGGYNPYPIDCESTYTDGEWCWVSDSCKVIIMDYSVDEDDVLDIPDFEQNGSDMDIWKSLYGDDPDIL